MNILWLTDIHLDYLFPKERKAFLSSLGRADPEVVLAGGDISKADSLEDDLRAIRKATNAQVYFILGNHDYFGSSFAAVKEKMKKLVQEWDSLRWLENMSFVTLAEGVALLGQGCWGDAGVGSYWKSHLHKGMPDFREIIDLKVLDSKERLEFLKQLGEEAANHLRESCRAAAEEHRHVIILTHVPPFPQSLVNDGEIDEASLPFFCCLSAGKALREVADAYPKIRFTVLSGHTHQKSRVRISHNLEALVQEAHYHRPTSRTLILQDGIIVDIDRRGKSTKRGAV
jgi:predicted MPP superfamily phosphohydrolase